MARYIIRGEEAWNLCRKLKMADFICPEDEGTNFGIDVGDGDDGSQVICYDTAFINRPWAHLDTCIAVVDPSAEDVKEAIRCVSKAFEKELTQGMINARMLDPKELHS